MAQYVLGTSNISTIIDFIDVDSEKWREYAQRASFPLSSLYQREAELLAKYEEKLTLTFDHSILSSEAEAQVLRKRVKDSRVTVISNGVDLQYFSSLAIASPVNDRNDRPIIVFTGVMDYFPNVDAVQYFCQEMFPLILDELPAAEFYIVGRNPTREVSRLGKHRSVVVTGTVPDVRPYLAQATVAVAPFRVARGVQNKVLEAMAMGVSVVGTTEAFKGIAVTERDGIRIANDARPFAQHVMTFLQVDATLRRQHARQARAYVERHHRWEDQGAKLEQLLDDIVWANIAKKSPEMKNAV
jgi:sugar transferase (PEP-CTERM/EpsH1 system associated)